MFNQKQTIFSGLAVFWIAAMFALLIGWVINIVKLFQLSMPLGEWSTFEVARAVGVFFPPLGGVLGWM